MKLSCRPWSLYHADVFHSHLLFSQLFWTLHLWSRLTALPPPLSFSSPFHLEQWQAPTHPCLFATDTPGHCGRGGGRRRQPAAPAITQPPLSPSSFWFLLDSSWPPSLCHFYSQTIKLLFVLPLVSFHCRSRPLLHVALVLSHHGHPSLCEGSLSLSVILMSCFILKPASVVSFLTSAFPKYLVVLYINFTRKIQEHEMILAGLHCAVRRKYVHS